MSKECCRCSHKWVARTAERPKNCPKCKSPYWDKPRVRGLTPAKEVEDTVEALWNEYAVPTAASPTRQTVDEGFDWGS